MNRRRRIAALACALVLPAWGAAPAGAQAPPRAPEAAPAPPVDPALDVAAPRLVLGGRRFQLLAPRLEAHGTCSERCAFEATARVHGVPRLSKLRVITPVKASEGGTRTQFAIRVSLRAHKLMAAALRDGRRVRVELEVYAYDMADNETVATRLIRVGPPADPFAPLRRS